MDKLQKTALAYQLVMQAQYYFEIAKKNTKREFVLTFEREDFFHMAGLHKLKDVTTLQIQKSRGIIYDRILEGNITLDQVENSFFYQLSCCCFIKSCLLHFMYGLSVFLGTRLSRDLSV